MALEITDKNFESSVINSDKLVMLDFWAEWCGPCKQLTPIVDELSVDFKDKAVIAKLNVDTNPTVSNKFGIRSIPTILFLKNGEVVGKQVGFATKAKLAGMIETHL